MSKKIMVVDDEPDILFTVGQMLEISGYEIIKAKIILLCNLLVFMKIYLLWRQPKIAVVKI